MGQCAEPMLSTSQAYECVLEVVDSADLHRLVRQHSDRWRLQPQPIVLQTNHHQRNGFGGDEQMKKSAGRCTVLNFRMFTMKSGGRVRIYPVQNFQWIRNPSAGEHYWNSRANLRILGLIRICMKINRESVNLTGNMSKFQYYPALESQIATLQCKIATLSRCLWSLK